MRNIDVSTARINYPEKRCIVNDGFFNVEDIEKYDIYRYKNKFLELFGVDSKGYICKDIRPSIFRKNKFYYNFNYIAETNFNWGATFETTIPRIPSITDIHRRPDSDIDYSNIKALDNYLKLLSKNNCKFLNALSNSAYNIQMELISEYPEYQEVISNKIEVLHPPQKILIESKDINNSDILEFIFVGRDFYRKGGAEVVLAFDSLISDGVLTNRNIKLNIIGNIDNEFNYVHGDYQDDDLFHSNIKKIISSSDYIKIYPSLDNSELMKLISTQDLGLLPTWGDTYGYSVLEMQACFVPVITTSVRALPEINLQSNIISLPSNKFGELIIQSYFDKNNLREAIISNLKSKIMGYFYNRVSIKDSAQLSIEKLKKDHDYNKYLTLLKIGIMNKI